MDAEPNLSTFFNQGPDPFHDTNFFDAAAAAAASDLFSVLEAWEAASSSVTTASDQAKEEFAFPESEHRCKKQKLNSGTPEESGQHRVSHITVERNRRKQMNEHLAVLRSLMPCFYVKRGDQASIIGGVVDYIHELQQILHSLESKRHRKAYSDVLSPRPAPSPRKPPLSPRLNLSLPISPRTPQSSSPYKPTWMGYHLNNSPTPVDRLPPPSPGCSSSVSNNDAVNELVAVSKSAAAEVEVKFSGPNLVLKTVSHPIRGQAVRIVSALEDLALEILHLKISTVDHTMLNLFTIKIGIECQVSAEELAQQIQQTFC